MRERYDHIHIFAKLAPGKYANIVSYPKAKFNAQRGAHPCRWNRPLTDGNYSSVEAGQIRSRPGL